jgi:pyrimidine deaminase RibD-like protein
VTTTDADFAARAVEEARRSIQEPDRAPIFVGAVASREGVLLETAYRGEFGEGEHAEFTLLERKLKNATLTRATIFATLEPCTRRGPGKIPCVDRLIARRVSRVFIGTLDPNPAIRGMGHLSLRNAGISVQLFPDDLQAQLEEMNRDFFQLQRGNAAPPPDRAAPATAPARLVIRERSADEVVGHLKGITLSHKFHETAEQLYVGRWTQEPGWQATVTDLPSELSAGRWYCSLKEAGSGTLVFASTDQDVSALRPGDEVTVIGRIDRVSQLGYVSLEDAIVQSDKVSAL